MSKNPHRQKQEDAEALAAQLVVCVQFANSCLREDGINLGTNEYYYRVVEHVCEIDFDDSMPYKQKAKDLARFAAVCETLALQFRQAAINTMEAGE
jgi:hypothetical protein